MCCVFIFYMDVVNVFEFSNKNEMVFEPQKNHFDFVLVQHCSLAHNAV